MIIQDEAQLTVAVLAETERAGDPRIKSAGIAWLGNQLAAVGRHLEADRLLLSGSFTRPVSVESNTVIHADFGPLGSIGVAFR